MFNDKGEELLYTIEYFDRLSQLKVRYMNNSGFYSRERAISEIRLLKKHDRKLIWFYGKIIRIKFKIIENKIKQK